MSDLATPLRTVLEATGYLSDGKPAPSVDLGESARRGPGRSSFHPDARWHSRAHDLTVYFKYAERRATRSDVANWQQEIWNESRSPLLWVVGPERVDLYNGFDRPRVPEDIDRNRLKVCRYDQLGELDDYAGRLVMETGQFWRNESRVNRRNAVDRRLLDHLRVLQDRLIDGGLPMLESQGLIGRCIFAKYLVDRGIVTEQRLRTDYGYDKLEQLLWDRDASQRLFAWLGDMFNGDMFPPGSAFVPSAEHLERVARFLDGEDPRSGQMSLFPYRFDIIPIELISAIYEQFVHLRTLDGEPRNTSRGVHYTPVPVVSLVLDEVMQGLGGKETVLDITCGSGIFLVEALRRLVRIKAGGAPPTRTMIRETLYKQIHGIDISEPAIRVAAFSLVLAALELDPDPRPTRSLRFKTLQGNTLLVGNAYDIETTAEGRKLTTNGGVRKFDLIVGNPPWERGDRGHVDVPAAPDIGTTSLRYLTKSMAFAHDRTRFGVVLSAKAFFSHRPTWLASAQNLVGELSPLTLVNLANLRPWLFPKADMPGMLLLARYRKQNQETLELIQTEWSRTGKQGHVIDTVPSDIQSLPIAAWRSHPELLKAALYGRLHDQLLLDDLRNELAPLAERLDAIGVGLAEGLKRGSSQDASHLVGMPLLERGGLRPFAVNPVRATFQDLRAEKPRGVDIYKAPLLLIQETIPLLGGGGRVVSAVSREDVVYPDQFDGASFAGTDEDAAYLVAAILGSAFVSWYLIMASSDFGLWKRRALLSDIRLVPVPDIEKAVESSTGARVVALAKRFEAAEPNDDDWRELDEAILDLYDFDETQRLVVRDGLFRTTWQWDDGRMSSIKAATSDHLKSYVRAFTDELDFWFYAANERRLRGEVVSLPESAPVRIVRFVLEDKPPPSITGEADEGSLNDVLARMSDRYDVRVGEALATAGELQIGNAREVVLIKPSARRHWLTVNALSDARRVLENSFQGKRT
ncbi:MAG: N-6 DNA methylase [Gammaproteobacteria bacterium]|nr:N-6 DNA methylase [Gammaproteobacteria bacterium]